MPNKKKEEEVDSTKKSTKKVSPVKKNVIQEKDDEIAILKSRLAKKNSVMDQISSIRLEDATFKYTDEMDELSYLDGYQAAMAKLSIAQPNIAETSISKNSLAKNSSGKKAWKVINYTGLDKGGAQLS